MKPTSELAANLAAEVRAEMARKSCSVTALAQFMGLHRQTVSRLIHSNQPMDISQLEQIGVLLGVDPVTLVARATAA